MKNAKLETINVPVSDELRRELGRVAVLFGGESAEREVSLLSGTAVLNALLAANVNAVGIDTGRDALQALQQVDVDRAFIVLHGAGGENGSMQALLSYLGIPFTGSAVAASALAMDKLRSKQLWSGVGLPTAKFFVLTDDSDWKEVITELDGAAMVKPAHEGSSLGMSRVNSAAELQAAYTQAKQFDRSVIAEALIAGPEYTVSILGQDTLPPIRLETNNIFYDYEAKYISEETRYHCPCGLPPAEEARLRQLAMDAYKSLGCEGWGRVDIMANEQGQFFVLEVNTVPGMTSHSLVPMSAKAAGLSFEDLVVRILLSKDYS